MEGGGWVSTWVGHLAVLIERDRGKPLKILLRSGIR